MHLSHAALRRALNAAVAGVRAALPHAEVTEVTQEPPPRQGTGSGRPKAARYFAIKVSEPL